MGARIILAGIACYLGDPYPRPGDLHLHLIFGTLYSGIGVALVLAGRKVGRLARSHIKQQE